MERELWPRLYHLIMEVGQTLRRLIDVSFQPQSSSWSSSGRPFTSGR